MSLGFSLLSAGPLVNSSVVLPVDKSIAITENVRIVGPARGDGWYGSDSEGNEGASRRHQQTQEAT